MLLRPRLKMLLLRLVLLRLMGLVRLVLLVVLRLMVLLRLAGVERLGLRGIGLAAHLRLLGLAVVVAIVGGVAARLAARLLLVIGLALAQLFLGGGDQAEIMFGVLIVIFSGDRVPGALRVAGELQIFFRDVGRRSPDLYVLPVRLVNARQRILVMMMMTTLAAIATAHALVLTVSHGSMFQQPH